MLKTLFICLLGCSVFISSCEEKKENKKASSAASTVDPETEEEVNNAGNGDALAGGSNEEGEGPGEGTAPAEGTEGEENEEFRTDDSDMNEILTQEDGPKADGTISLSEIAELREAEEVDEFLLECASTWAAGDFPFTRSDIEALNVSLATATRVSYRDNSVTQAGRLVAINVQSPELQSLSLDMQNPKGWYCINLEISDADKVSMQAECSAKVHFTGVSKDEVRRFSRENVAECGVSTSASATSTGNSGLSQLLEEDALYSIIRNLNEFGVEQMREEFEVRELDRDSYTARVFAEALSDLFGDTLSDEEEHLNELLRLLQEDETLEYILELLQSRTRSGSNSGSSTIPID